MGDGTIVYIYSIDGLSAFNMIDIVNKNSFETNLVVAQNKDNRVVSALLFF